MCNSRKHAILDVGTLPRVGYSVPLPPPPVTFSESLSVADWDIPPAACPLRLLQYNPRCPRTIANLLLQSSRMKTQNQFRWGLALWFIVLFSYQWNLSMCFKKNKKNSKPSVHTDMPSIYSFFEGKKNRIFYKLKHQSMFFHNI